jgi:chondroitin 4-sulfotransferase 11
MQILPEVVNTKIDELRGRAAFSQSFIDTQSIMIHVPKAAGTSLSAALYGQDVGHHSIAYVLSKAGCDVSTFFKFGFVRNPWSRLYSAYEFAKVGGTIDRPYMGEVVAPSFESFVIDQLSVWDVERKDFVFRSQAGFVCVDGKIALDFVGRFENIENDFRYVASVVNSGATLDQLNSIRRGFYENMYSKEMLKVVAEVYAKDIEILGYEFCLKQ